MVSSGAAPLAQQQAVLPAAVTPTSDFTITYTLGSTWDGQSMLQQDLALGPRGDVALCNGIDRLIQDMTRWLLTPQGAYPGDPNWGNPFWTQLGRPLAADLSTYAAMVDDMERTFLLRQQQQAAAGTLDLAAQLASIDTVIIQTSGPGLLAISFTVTTRAQETRDVTVAIPGATLTP